MPATLHPPINSHIHLPPNFSAFDTVDQAVGLAKLQGIRALGVSNYYDFGVYGTFQEQADSTGITPLYGLEIIALLKDLQAQGVKINDPGNPGKMYICGKGIARFNPMTDEAAALMQTIRDQDGTRMQAMTERMTALFSEGGVETGLDVPAIQQRIVARHGSPVETVYLQERHIAQAFQERLFELVESGRRSDVLTQLYGTLPKAESDDAVGVQNDLRTFLMKTGKPAYVPETFVDFDHAHRLILALGGIPCYPVLADGASPICGFESDPSALVQEMKHRKVHFAEVIPIRNCHKVLEEYVRAIRAAHIPVTAGTEHNTLDLLPMQPLCLNGAAISDELRGIFWEGFCVALGHQAEVSEGRPGYVISSGELNPNYPDDEARIAAFRQIGETALAA